MSLIPSYQQAQSVGERQRKPFTVFSYVHPAARVTLFGVRVGNGEQIITTM